MYRLLIADDEEEIRNGLADCFPWGEVGFRVTARAENGKRALEIIEHEEVDAVLTDIRMPLMSGIDLARHIFERHLDLPVVFLSAYKDFAYAQKAIQYGVRRYVLKPTDYSELASVFSALKRELDSGISPATPDAPEGNGAHVPKSRPDADGAAATRSEGDADRAQATRSEPDARRAQTTRPDSIIDFVKGYVRREYATASLASAARMAHLNAQYLSRLFKSATGEHFNEYLQRIKMKKAAELLADVGYATYEVSAIVGYRNPKNFTRSFKRHFGMPPRAYRLSARGFDDLD